MAKSNKATVLRRIQDVTRLILAGAEFAEVRQYAAEQGWQVSTRQIRRYMERCYKRLAQYTERNRKDLLGRHLMQRRALFARALKNGDVRSALHALRDEAALEGLYPATKIAGALSLGRHDLAGNVICPLPRSELICRQIAAEIAKDESEQQLLAAITPIRQYHLPVTMLPISMYHTATLMYVVEQLEQLASFLHSVWQASSGEEDEQFWTDIALLNAYRFRIGQEAWEQFMKERKLDAKYFLSNNYFGIMLELGALKLCELAPSAEQVPAISARIGVTHEKAITVQDLVNSWRALFRPFNVA